MDPQFLNFKPKRKLIKLKKSICFVALNIHSLLKNNSSSFIGGAEVQQILIGKELVERGYSISYITLDHGQGKLSRIGSFEIISAFSPSEGIPVLRFFWPRLIKIWQALNRTNSDIYYCRCAGFLLGIVVYWARLNNKKVIYCGAVDQDFEPKSVPLKHYRDKWIYFWGLKRCAGIVVQNSHQKIMLRKNFLKDSTIIHNGWKKYGGTFGVRDTILWVANIKKFKDPLSFINLAKRFPDEKFVMVGGKVEGHEDLYEYVTRESKELTNLKFKGFLPLEKTEKEFDKAKLFVNTSLQEGFPNTFLQAWRQGIPVISFVDPDGLIAKHSLGKKAANIEDMINDVKKCLTHESHFNSEIIKTFFNENLVIEKQVDEYEKIFKSLVKYED